MIDILFINTTETNELRYQTNGTMILSTKLLNAGYNVEIFRFSEINYSKDNYSSYIDKIVNHILSYNAKCISFYTLWPYYHILLRIAQKIKEINSNIIIVFGGPQSSATALETMKSMNFVDYISTGEGENIVVPFFNSILKNNKKNISDIPGLYYRENLSIKFNNSEVDLCDLNSIPYWDESLYTIDENNLDSDTYFMPIDAGRGCPYSCTFCCTSLFWKRTYRLKSPERIVDDIKFYNKKFGIKSFWFSHDAFTTNNKLVSDVCDYILKNKLNIKWRCTARIDCISKELILKMKSCGLTQIELGIETGSQRMQKIINKNLNLEKAKEMISFLIVNKINVSLFFMYGFPEETETDLNQTLDLLFSVVDLGVKHASMSFCRFNPSTHITNQYFDSLILDEKIKILFRGVLGVDEEFQMIQENKSIFSHFYHLDTPVRNKYQYLYFFSDMYQKFPNSSKFIRKIYKGDNLKFYHDFYNNNLDFFDNDILFINNYAKDKLLQLYLNTVKNFDSKFINQIKSLIEYDCDIQQISKSKDDVQLQKIYNFSYVDYKMEIPIEKFSDKKTEILLEKKDGAFNMKILSII